MLCWVVFIGSLFGPHFLLVFPRDRFAGKTTPAEGLLFVMIFQGAESHFLYMGLTALGNHKLSSLSWWLFVDYSTICHTLNTSFIKHTKYFFHMNVELYLYLPSVKYSGVHFVTSILQTTSLRHRRLRNLCMGLYFMSNVWGTREAGQMAAGLG